MFQLGGGDEQAPHLAPEKRDFTTDRTLGAKTRPTADYLAHMRPFSDQSTLRSHSRRLRLTVAASTLVCRQSINPSSYHPCTSVNDTYM
jgi:hypothetical protein